MSIRLSMICHAPMPSAGGVAFFGDESVDPEQLRKVIPARSDLGKFERVWTAPELRTRETAAMLNPAVTIVPDLRDCDFGRWRGRELTAIHVEESAAVSTWLADMSENPHGGEALLDVVRRTGQWLDQYDQRGHTIAVTHPAVIRAAVIRVLDAPPQSFWRIDVEPLTIADFRQHNGRWTLRSVGSTLR